MGLFIRAVTDDGGPTRPLSERGDKEGGIGQGLPVHPAAEDGPVLRFFSFFS